MERNNKDEIIEKIKDLAKDDDRSFSQYINMVLRKHIAEVTGDTEK